MCQEEAEGWKKPEHFFRHVGLSAFWRHHFIKKALIRHTIFCACILCPSLFLPGKMEQSQTCRSWNCCSASWVWGVTKCHPHLWQTAQEQGARVAPSFLTIFFSFPRQKLHTFSCQLCSLMDWILGSWFPSTESWKVLHCLNRGTCSSQPRDS